MYQTMQKAAKDVEECKEMLVNMQRQLNRIEEEQGWMVRGSLLESAEKKDETGKNTSNIKKFEENSSEDSRDEEEDEEQVEEQVHGRKSKVALAAMAGGAILIGGALQHQLR